MKKITAAQIWKVKGSERNTLEDFLVTEEPLEIRLAVDVNGTRVQKSISVTMRTPGNDEELALGFLYTEGMLTHADQVHSLYSVPVRRREARENIVVVELQPGVEIDFRKLERHFYTSSSCGVCGKASIEAVEVTCHYELPENQPVIDGRILHELPGKLLANQSIFDCTGGLHGAALFDTQGTLIASREDIGRHNALDKLIGQAFQQGQLPLSNSMVLVSGRAGFELVQKSILAGIPIFAAVGAPSSLAVRLAEEAGMTLIGFLREGQFNIYTHAERVKL